MKRRTFIVLLLAGAGRGLAQPSTRPGPRRVAICLGPSKAPDPIGPTKAAYAKEFERHGLVDGRDIEIVILRSRSWVTVEEVLAPVRQAVALRAAVILTFMGGDVMKTNLLAVSRDIPLVVWGPDDGSGDNIDMLNRRGENVTGAMVPYIELLAKRFELMKELRPNARRAAVVTYVVPPADRGKDETRRIVDMYTARAHKLGMEFAFVELRREASADDVIRALRNARVDIAEVLCCRGRQLWERLAKAEIAASVVGPEGVRDGALLGGWSVGFYEAAIRLAARVLRGERAAAIPVERPMEFGLAINLRTARTLGITVPASVLVRAQEVFE